MTTELKKKNEYIDWTTFHNTYNSYDLPNFKSNVLNKIVIYLTVSHGWAEIKFNPLRDNEKIKEDSVIVVAQFDEKLNRLFFEGWVTAELLISEKNKHKDYYIMSCIDLLPLVGILAV